jgi:mono/diheme cytochrome c family protein
MKKIVIAAGCLALSLGFISCSGAHGDDPGHSYMPDMYYSRAYESYNYNDVGGELDTLKRRGITYTGLPVPGTVARGEMLSYHLTNDSAGLNAANALKSPLDSVTAAPASMKEAERIYLVNCGICHGPKLDGDGPLWNGGNGPFPVAPRNLTDDYTKKLTDGHIFHVITYGIRSMGSYASQLNPQQRWWVIKYIRSKQGGGAVAAADTTKAAGAKDVNTPHKLVAPVDTTKTK